MNNYFFVGRLALAMLRDPIAKAGDWGCWGGPAKGEPGEEGNAFGWPNANGAGEPCPKLAATKNKNNNPK